MCRGKRTFSLCGTTDIIAPEVYDDNNGYDSSSDWWALGCFIYNLLVGDSPFHSLNSDLVKINVLTKPPNLETLNFEAGSLISSLLQKQPAERLKDPKAIKKHAFFRSIDWT